MRTGGQLFGREQRRMTFFGSWFQRHTRGSGDRPQARLRSRAKNRKCCVVCRNPICRSITPRRYIGFLMHRLPTRGITALMYRLGDTQTHHDTQRDTAIQRHTSNLMYTPPLCSSHFRKTNVFASKRYTRPSAQRTLPAGFRCVPSRMKLTSASSCAGRSLRRM